MDADRGDLVDEALREEIELVGELVVAASASPGRMAEEDLDLVLGIPCPDATRSAQATRTGNGSNPLNPTVE